MKEYLISHRFTLLGWTAILIVGIALGFMARPGFDNLAKTYFTEQEPYIAKAEDNRTPLQKAMAEEIEKYKKTSDYTTLIEKIAVEHVGQMLSIDISSITGEAESIKETIEKKQVAQVEQHKLREIYGISDKTATATIKLEEKQGRR